MKGNKSVVINIYKTPPKKQNIWAWKKFPAAMLLTAHPTLYLFFFFLLCQ